MASEGLTTAALREGIARMTAKMAACANELNQLDGALGDGDLGVTLLRGTQGLLEAAPELPDDVGLALLRCAQVFTKVSGSTFGTLIATGLMSASKGAKGRDVVPWPELSTLLAGAVADMMARGKGALGDKTVLDALDAARAAIADGDDPAAMAAAADAAVAMALERLRDTPARQGRARIFAERSVGLDDPGMVAIKRLIEGLRDA